MSLVFLRIKRDDQEIGFDRLHKIGRDKPRISANTPDLGWDFDIAERENELLEFGLLIGVVRAAPTFCRASLVERRDHADDINALRFLERGKMQGQSQCFSRMVGVFGDKDKFAQRFRFALRVCKKHD